MRILALTFALLAACSGSERPTPGPRVPSALPPATPAAAPVAPGLRLPDGVTPLAYDLTLDVDPDRDTFAGQVHIQIRLDRASDHLWIHADQLAIQSARIDGAELTELPLRGDQMIGYRFGRTLPAGEHELVFEYTGRTTGDQEGLFRQKTADDWYLFSQGESVFARRITPCFDEPRFKTPWRVTLVVPRPLAAIANAPEEATTVEGDKKRVRFAESPVMASYLLTIAVGPFDVVDAGTVGARKVPVRVAVHAGAGKQVEVVAAKLPRIVEAMEAYVGEPLPLRKLDLVGVPRFFGAMENPGIITFEEPMLVGKDTKQRAAYFTHIAAHELAHQWFGNSVTPAWWDDLWLSESFASFVGDKIASRLGAFDERPLNTVLERREALDADAQPDALPLRRPIENNRDPDNAFDAIAYQKGEAVLATFEALVGEDAFRDALRGYVVAHRDRSATTFEFVAALGTATTSALGKAFEQYATQAGAPVVDVALRCDRKPALIASARDGRFVPLCIAYPAAKRTCALVGDKTELALGASCPAWLDTNAAAGYYTVHWQDRSPTQWLAKLPSASRVIVGDDLAASFRRGELVATDAMRELRTLLAGDLDTQVAGLALAREIDAVVDDAARPAWSAWLARRVPKPKRVDRGSVAGQLVRELSALLLPADRLAKDQQRKTRAVVDKLIADDRVPDEELVAAVADRALFDRIVDKARTTQDREKRERWLSLLGELPAAFAAPTAALVDESAGLPVEPIWDALEAYFANPAARLAAWQALHAHLGTFMKRATHHGEDMIESAGLLCDATSRGEVATAFEPYLARVPGGRAHLDAALASIDRCIARRGTIGDLAAAIATSR